MEMKWIIPRDLLPASVTIMRPNGTLGFEGLALWFGKADSGVVQVTHVVSVHGPGIHASPLSLTLSLRAFAALTDFADHIESYLVGQIHSHPGLMLDLSDADIIHGIRRQDYLSVVCPYYAQKDVANLHECGVHVFDGCTYRRMYPREQMRRIRSMDYSVIRASCEVPL